MPYISQLLNNTVTDSSDNVVGRLDDVLISLKEGFFAPLEFLAVLTYEKKILYVPYEYVENFTSKEISLKSSFSKISFENLPDNRHFIPLKKEVLDRQIVDITGTRLVRVNDLRIGDFKSRMCVLAIDASFKGFLRRMDFSDNIFTRWIKPSLIDWRQAQLLDSGPLKLKTLSEEMRRLHPADLANIVEELDVKQGSTLLTSLGDSQAAKVLEEVEPHLQNLLVKYLGPEKAGKILSQMSSDEVVDLIKTFSSEDAGRFLSKVSGNKVQRVQKLLKYANNTAGGLMTPDFVSARPDWKVEQVVEEVKKASPGLRSLVYVYVTSEDGKFHGVVSLRRILLAKPDDIVKNLSKSVNTGSLKATDKLKKIIKLMTRYNLNAAAVLDKNKKLLGVVTIDDVLRQLFPHA
ncbi:MAG: magnesium transporter [Candidatus Doudnabacteria bacterium]|nr:magnesium transporter [Candidatus Doudnabacteria bacterium]